MESNIMKFEEFDYYMTKLKNEYDWREMVTGLGIDVTDHMDSFYYAIDLMSFMFKDAEELIPFFIFEADFGRNTDVIWFEDNNNKITNTKELYDILTERA